MRFLIITSLLLLWAFSAKCICYASEGLERTNLSSLELKEYKVLGVKILMPRNKKNLREDIYDAYKCTDVLRTGEVLSVCMHPFRFGSLREPEWIMTFVLTKLSSRDFDVFLKGKHECVNNDWCFDGKPSMFAGEITQRTASPPISKMRYLCFRKDIKLPTGDVIIARGKILDASDMNPQQKDDIEILKTILNSIRWLCS